MVNFLKLLMTSRFFKFFEESISGAQGISLALIGWVSGNTFVWVGRFLGVISDLILARVLRFVFGRTFGVGIELSRMIFLICLPLPATKGSL
jgi:hypothetical protein